MGVSIEEGDEQLLIKPNKPLKSVDIKTLVYPGFPTDLQQPFTTLLTKAENAGVVTDTIYSARLKHIDELRRMNALIKVEGGSAIVTGPVQLAGASVKASDLRAGAALIVAGLMADGITEITGVEHIERGYEQITEKLVHLGAKIWREDLTVGEETEMRESENNSIENDIKVVGMSAFIVIYDGALKRGERHNGKKLNDGVSTCDGSGGLIFSPLDGTRKSR